MPAPVGEVLPRVPEERCPVGDHWVQVGLAPDHRQPRRTLLGELAALVRDWRAGGVVDDFFFMHKPPGLRVRFAAAPGRTPFLRAEVDRLAAGWRADGLVAGVEPGTYVPETHRFGGEAAMDHVHRMFTADAVAWLGFHAGAATAPAWALSFVLLRQVFDAMGLGERRERAVWAGVAGAGRLVPAEAPSTEAAGRRLWQWWRRPDELLAALPDDVRRIAAAHAAEVSPHAAAWATTLRGGDGDTDSDTESDTESGGEVAEAVTWYVVFHWNRAALSFGRQALLTAALTTGERGRDHVR
ncbi:thiopeptide-type bacteriocin biosynthesis protein [Actinophytocola sp.]|uniref:thiopeptide-type bacteriocin biosynthesis protein n=1 Tax=Actinophytocola sp. TaxID=1872138 RepID=UPI00389A6F76